MQLVSWWCRSRSSSRIGDTRRSLAQLALPTMPADRRVHARRVAAGADYRIVGRPRPVTIDSGGTADADLRVRVRAVWGPLRGAGAGVSEHSPAPMRFVETRRPFSPRSPPGPAAAGRQGARQRVAAPRARSRRSERLREAESCARPGASRRKRSERRTVSADPARPQRREHLVEVYNEASAACAARCRPPAPRSSSARATPTPT